MVIPLNEAAINANVPRSPGAYGLITNKTVVYFGRSDHDLNGRLKDHLPGRKTNSCIRSRRPTRAMFQATATAWEKYHLKVQQRTLTHFR